VHCLQDNVVGVFNAVGFAGPVTMAELLAGCKCASSSAVTFTWASEEFLRAHEVGAWMEMPLWIPREHRSRILNARAIDKGLRFRPLADTIRDTLQWARSERGDKPFERTGCKPEKERALLQAWHEQHKAAAK
jgi:2'-hydroxyisoflavone reductase